MIPQRGGLPHSDTHGSKPARGSPWIFAACHVLHRLLVPRHPPNALLMLTHHAQEPPTPPAPLALQLRETNNHRRGRPAHRRPFSSLNSTQHYTHIPDHCRRRRARHQCHVGTGARVRHPRNAPTDEPRAPGQATCAQHMPSAHPSRPAHPGMHQNLIHLSKDHHDAGQNPRPHGPSSAAPGTPPNTVLARQHRTSRHDARGNSTKGTGIRRSRTNQRHTGRTRLETDGFEPTTPCLQSRCSPS